MVTPTRPRPSMGRRSRLERRPLGPESSARGNNSSPASVKRLAANSMGGTSSTTSFTAVKLVPKKKTVSSSEPSTSPELCLFSFVNLADEVGVPVELLHVGEDQTRAVLQVPEVHDLIRGVHVTVGRRDEPRGDAGAGELDGVGVRPRRARVGLQGVGDLRLLRSGDETVGDYRAQVGSPFYDGAAPEGVVTVLVLGDTGGIGRVGDVHGYCRVGVEAVRRTARPVEPYLLLHARHRHDLGANPFLLGEQPQSLEDDEGAHPVVQRARCDAPVGQLEETLVHDPDVADPDHTLGFFAILGADIDPEALYLGDLLALLGFHDVDGLLADDPRDLTVLRPETHPLADEHLRVPPANAGEAEQALLVYVGDHDPDLVYVPREHHPGRTAGVERGEGVAHPVTPDLGEVPGLRPPDLRRRALVAARPRRGEQPLQEFVRCVPHVVLSLG